MSQYNHTPLSTGAAANAATFNTAFGELDAAIKKNNYAATAAPTTGDDSGDGYSVGSRWIDTTNDLSYVCLDATLGAAVWGQAIRMLNGIGYINDNANSKMTIGLTVNQGANDDTIVAFKSSDVAHGMTSLTETDTFWEMSKYDGATGGAYLKGYSEDVVAQAIEGHATSTNNTRSASAGAALAPLVFRSWLKSGGSSGVMGADVNLAVFCSATLAKFILDSDGDSHQDVGTAWTNFDTHDDIALLNLLSAHVTRKDDPLRANFGTWLAQNRTELERIKLVQFNDDTDGRAFVNMSKLTMLLVGAVRQLAAQMETMKLNYANALIARD